MSYGSNGCNGDNRKVDSSSPVSVVGGRSFSAATGGNQFWCAIEGTTGRAYCWGGGGSGNLGNNLTSDQSSPVSVAGARSWKSITASGSSVWGIEASTGNVYAWGDNTYGTLGDNTTSGRSSPTSVVGGQSFKSLSVGLTTATTLHVAAIEGSTGNIYCWGYNAYGQLGNGTALNQSSPVSVLGGRSYSAIAAQAGSGLGGTYAVEGSTGIIYSWGYCTNGALGNNTDIYVGSPVSIGTVIPTF